MYDTIGMNLSKGNAGNVNFLDTIPLKLNNSFMHKNCKSDSIYYTGSLGNLIVVVTETELKIIGSICKWFYGNNLKTLTIHDTKLSIEKLSEILNLPMHKADITRIDFATNLIMEHHLSVYFNRLGNLNKYERLVQPKGLYYYNSINKKTLSLQLVFYDKIAECKAKNIPIPDEFKNKNVLRYEIRFLKRLLKKLNLSELKAEKLYDEKFFAKLVRHWQSHYNKIRKERDINKFDFSKITNQSLLNQQSLLALIKYSCGGEIQALKLIAEAQKKGMPRKLAHDIRKKIKSATNSKLFTMQSDYINELNEKIKNICL